MQIGYKMDVLFIYNFINLFLFLIQFNWWKHTSYKEEDCEQFFSRKEQLMKQFFKFGESCSHKNNLTVDNQHGSEDKDQRSEVKLSTERETN